MGILTQNTSEKQETIHNIFRNIPMILTDGGACLYYLVKNLSEEVEEFILTGKTVSGAGANADEDTGADELDVLPDAQQREMAELCERLGLAVKYHSQCIEYMNHKVRIKYPKVTIPKAGISISIIPWFVLSDRPYPVFIYVYGAYHYYSTGKKSLQMSAAAVGKMFGIESLHKSTICRSIKIMEQLFNISQIDRPLSTGEADAPLTAETEATTVESLNELITKILGGGLSLEALREIFGDKVKSLAEGAGQTENISVALSSIPHEYCEVLKEREHSAARRSDTRQRQKRERRSKPKKLPPVFIEPYIIERLRKEFIDICRNLVFDAAISYKIFFQ